MQVGVLLTFERGFLACSCSIYPIDTSFKENIERYKLRTGRPSLSCRYTRDS